MKTLVIYYSHSGHTEKFAQMIATKLTAAGHTAEMFELKTSSPIDLKNIPKLEAVELQAIPKAADFDLICIGTPLWAFRPTSIAIKAILDMTDLKGKKIVPFVTMGFPLAGMGGTAAIAQLTKLILKQGGIPLKGSVITQMFSKPELQMNRESERIAKLL